MEDRIIKTQQENHKLQLGRTTGRVHKLTGDLQKYAKSNDPELKDYINAKIKRLSAKDLAGETKCARQVCLLAARTHTSFVAHLLKNPNTLLFIFSNSPDFAESKEESPLEAAFKNNQGKEFLSADLPYTS